MPSAEMRLNLAEFVKRLPWPQINVNAFVVGLDGTSHLTPMGGHKALARIELERMQRKSPCLRDSELTTFFWVCFYNFISLNIHQDIPHVHFVSENFKYFVCFHFKKLLNTI